MARDMAVTSVLPSVRIHWLVVSLYSILVDQSPKMIMLPGLSGSCFGTNRLSMRDEEQRLRNLSWVTTRAALVNCYALKLKPGYIPGHICECHHAVVCVTEASVPCIFSVIWFSPVIQLLASVVVPPNCLHSFQLLCLIADNL